MATLDSPASLTWVIAFLNFFIRRHIQPVSWIAGSERASRCRLQKLWSYLVWTVERSAVTGNVLSQIDTRFYYLLYVNKPLSMILYHCFVFWFILLLPSRLVYYYMYFFLNNEQIIRYYIILQVGAYIPKILYEYYDLLLSIISPCCVVFLHLNTVHFKLQKKLAEVVFYLLVLIPYISR